MSRKGFDINEWLTPENKTRIRGWCLDGLIDKQIYKNMGISRTTFYKWKSENSEFADLLKRGKEIADCEVENALFKSATGFIGPDDKYYPPNTTAQIFWLKNRKKDDWKDKREQDVSVSTPISDTAMKVEAILKGDD
nr:MAG TPA: terminase small subunit [Caudoviricetes sp.]